MLKLGLVNNEGAQAELMLCLYIVWLSSGKYRVHMNIIECGRRPLSFAGEVLPTSTTPLF